MNNMLKVGKSAVFDESIVRYQERSIFPASGTKYESLSEVRLALDNRDVIVHPHESYLYLEGKLDGDGEIFQLSNNGLAFLFEEVRYELNSTQIDQNRNTGITSTLKTVLSATPDEEKALTSFGWDMEKQNDSFFDKQGKFSACLPLSNLLGFAEDHKSVILHGQHELVLIIAKNQKNCFEMKSPSGQQECKLKLFKIVWKVPFVKPSEESNLQLLKMVDSYTDLLIFFRTWEIHKFPLLPTTTNASWFLNNSVPLEISLFIILGFQTGRKDNLQKSSSEFDHCDLSNLKVFLNDESFPYDNLNLDFGNNRFSILYRMFCQFQKQYYSKENSNPLLTQQELKEIAPIVVIDCSRQKEIIYGHVNVHIEFEPKKNFPPDTTCYCMVIHDKMIQYNPLDHKVTKA